MGLYKETEQNGDLIIVMTFPCILVPSLMVQGGLRHRLPSVAL